MARSRTIKTLAALLASMVVGAFVLIQMETPPARPEVPFPLMAPRGGPSEMAVDVVDLTDADVEIQYIKWRNIIVHQEGEDCGHVASQYHFIIPDSATIEPTVLWRRQLEGNHIRVPGYSFNSNSIGVCLGRGDPPTAGQMEALIQLVRALQVACQIPADHVYLHSELSQLDCPGPNFPARAFRSRLIASSR